jgi:hypothetical protein
MERKKIYNVLYGLRQFHYDFSAEFKFIFLKIKFSRDKIDCYSIFLINRMRNKVNVYETLRKR